MDATTTAYTGRVAELGNQMEFGVWGGMTERQRRAFTRCRSWPMTTRKLTTMTSPAVAAVLTAVAMMMAPPSASADSTDDQFLGSLSDIGVTGDPDTLISAAHTACDNMGAPNGLGFVGEIFGAGVRPRQFTQFMLTAGRAYCPDKLHSTGHY
jgi:hypothetical protein